MGRDQFQFKQFTIIQDRCGMKVTTDGVLLGAWTNPNGVGRILDIGTGTGLIALMLAQRCQAKIDAVEIDREAYLQAQENVARSPWQQRITVYHASVQDYTLTCPYFYDLIVSNPPFFTQVSPAKNPARSLARHDDQFRMIDLLNTADRLLTNPGKMTLIYPYLAVSKLQETLQKFNFFCHQVVDVKPTPQSLPKRILIEISRQPIATSESELVIQNSQQNYTPNFIHLVRDFYLKY